MKAERNDWLKRRDVFPGANAIQLGKTIKDFIIFSIKKASYLKVPLVTEEQQFYVDNNLQHRCFCQDDGGSERENKHF